VGSDHDLYFLGRGDLVGSDLDHLETDNRLETLVLSAYNCKVGFSVSLQL
jgi:hypothetical protein